jgi:hypothetical protein
MFIQFPLVTGGVLHWGGWQIVMFIQYPLVSKDRKEEKKKRGGGGGFEGFVARHSYRELICRLWRKQRTTTTGRSDSYDNGIKFGSPEPRSSGAANACLLACSLYPLGTRASSWSGPHLSVSFVPTRSLRALLGPEFGSKFK